MSTQLELALQYAAMGLPIVPAYEITSRGICSCSKGAECKASGKHPRSMNGVKDASVDPNVINHWFTTWPQANIALACGAQSGVFVVDIDPRNDGFHSIDEYETDRGDFLPNTLTALTGGGGRHLFFRYPSDGQPLGNRINWLKGVDVKSDGGIVILPESNHISGRHYSWLNLEIPIADPPGDLLSSVRSSGTNGKAPLPNSADILEGVPEGARDETLFRWACRLRRQFSSEPDEGRAMVMSLVLEAARKSGFPEDEAKIKVEQAYKQDHSDKIWEWDFETPAGDPVHRLTDLGNAKRFADLQLGSLKYVPEWGWLRWFDGIGWERVTEYDVSALTRAVPDRIRNEAEIFAADPEAMAAMQKWATATEGAGHFSSIEKLARSDPRLLAKVEDFDTELHLLACRNGVVDLRTGQLLPFERDQLITKNTDVVYDPAFVFPKWEEFLETATEGDHELIAYIQQAFGYSLTGSNAEECMFIVSGPPASGKSTLIDGLHAASGTYGTTTQADTFMYKRGQTTAKDELARLAGMRVVTVSEIRQGDSFNETLIKQLTGGDLVTGRYLYKDTFEYRPQLKLWIGTNHDPDTRDEAMWRRLKKIAFNKPVPYDQRDPNLKAMIRDPEVGGRAVLAWAVRGAIEWYRNGKLTQPSTVTMATADYRSEQDRFGGFLSEVTVLDPTAAVTLRDLYSAYALWCKGGNEFALRTPQFTQELRRRGMTVVRSEAARTQVVPGVGMKPMQVTTTGVSWT